MSNHEKQITDKSIKCPVCGNIINEIKSLRCPRCYAPLLSGGCSGACKKCALSSSCQGSGFNETKDGKF